MATENILVKESIKLNALSDWNNRLHAVWVKTKIVQSFIRGKKSSRIGIVMFRSIGYDVR